MARRRLRNKRRYQEILHRYAAINRRGAINDAFTLLDDLVVSVFAISRDEVEPARQVAERHPALSARDCLHLAVMAARRVSRILSFDHGFSDYSGVTRLP